MPHFDIPFRFGLSPGQNVPAVQTVEQDSMTDIVNCVEVILRYPRGFRSDVPEFGIEDVTLRQQPIPLDDMLAAVSRWEPRARVSFGQSPDRLDHLIARVVAGVTERNI